MRLAIVDKDDVQANTVDGNYGDNGDYGEAYLYQLLELVLIN